MVQKENLPVDSLLQEYANEPGCYTDCYYTEIDRLVGLSDYVNAFYTTGLFKVERLILKYFISKPSTDVQANDLAAGRRSGFAAWETEKRTDSQLLMCDFRARTRSWFMVEQRQGAYTRLYFGSAVTSVNGTAKKNHKRGFVFSFLLGFHRLYSVALLSFAKRRLAKII